MNKKAVAALCQKIQDSYASRIALDDAEKLAGEFLWAETQLIGALATTGLDARQRKAGLKAIKASVYLEEAKKGDKKPSDVMLQAMVDTSELVATLQNALDEAEESHAELLRYYDTFQQTHIYFRQIAKTGI